MLTLLITLACSSDPAPEATAPEVEVAEPAPAPQPEPAPEPEPEPEPETASGDDPTLPNPATGLQAPKLGQPSSGFSFGSGPPKLGAVPSSGGSGGLQAPTLGGEAPPAQ